MDVFRLILVSFGVCVLSNFGLIRIIKVDAISPLLDFSLLVRRYIDIKSQYF